MGINSFDRNNSYGLLIGVGKRDADAEGMAITARDAAYLKKALQGMDILPEQNMQTLLEEQASKQNIIRALDALIESTQNKPADLVLIYFSGHGSGNKGAYHLICRDTTKANLTESAIAGTTFVEKLAAINCDKMLVLLDCCHSEGMTDSDIPFDSKTLHQKQNRIVLTACAANQVSYLSHPVSVFTYAVIETIGGKFLPEKEKDVRVFDLAMDVRERVVALSKEVLRPNNPQQPQLNVLENGQTSNFVLKNHPKGGPQEVRMLKEELRALTTPKGEPLRLDVPKEEDREFRNWIQHIIITNIATVKDNGVVVQGTNGPVEIKQGISGEELNAIFKTISAENRKLILELVQSQGGDRLKELERKMEEALLQLKIAAKKEELPEETINLIPPFRPSYWTDERKAENKISLVFSIDSFDKIGFTSGNLEPEFVKALQHYLDLGIVPDKTYIDKLCKNTITNGHNLLKSNGIFNINSEIVNPLSRVIGQYLFRLLFGDTTFQDLLRWAKKKQRELEIILQFDPEKKSFGELVKWPWELMYCPDRESADPEEEIDEEASGFFVSQEASIYRRYIIPNETPREIKGEVQVSVAFLSKDPENLNSIYKTLQAASKQAEEINKAIHFDFINGVKDGNVQYLPKEKLGEIFQAPSRSVESRDRIKVVHLICDVSITEYEGEPDRAMFFSKNDGVQPIALKEVLKILFAQNVFHDRGLKLIILQAWNQEEKAIYGGFEDIAVRFSRKKNENLPSILSMPYIMNQQKLKDGQEMFFQILYGGIVHAIPLIHIVQKLRTDIVQQYAYGFPMLYLNGHHQIIPGKDVAATITQEPSKTRTKETDTPEPGMRPIQQDEPIKVEAISADKKTGTKTLDPETQLEKQTEVVKKEDKVELSAFERAKLKKRIQDEENK